MVTAVSSLSAPYRRLAPAPAAFFSGDSVQLSPAALAPVPDTGLHFPVFQMRDFAGNPRGAPRDLTALTPAEVRAMPPEERQAFFELLPMQFSLGATAQSTYDDQRGAQTNVMNLGEVTLLHLFRQDPSLAGLIMETNPELVAGLHGGLTAGALSPTQREEANALARSVFGGEVGEEQSRALAAITAQTMQANGHDPRALQMLLEAADAGVASEFGAGAVLGSLLAGVRDSGEAPFDFLDKLPARFTPTGMVTTLLGKALARATDTRGVARENYLDLYDLVLAGLDEAGGADSWRGFAYAGRWNA